MNILKKFLRRKLIVAAFAIICTFILLYNTGLFHGQDTRVKVTCVGDSLTYGSGVLKNREIDSYPAQLQTRLGTSHEVRNFGLRNATASTNGDLPYFESDEYNLSLESNPDIVIIMLGTNDSKTYNWNAVDYEQGLRDLVNTYKSMSSKPDVYLVETPYCYSLDGGDVAEYDIQPAVIEEEIIPIQREVAEAFDVHFIEMQDLTEDESLFASDGIHFNADGYEVIAKEIEKQIK